MCVDRHKRNNQIQISELIYYITENSQKHNTCVIIGMYGMTCHTTVSELLLDT
jgi:hypothetical protein